jgi:predicted unusual protein kinase regulating ubiquinone biosynthesis (AarF/ABC1/UbiB family)
MDWLFMTTPRDDGVPQGRVRRTMPLAGFTARAAGGRIVAGLRERTGNAGAVDRFHERTAERYAQLLGHSKGVLMKAGQIFSMVDPGAVGNGELSPYQKALTRLQADAPAMDPQLAKEVLQADLGRPVEELFAEFSDEPMAAASIGQVHHAVLRDGRQVAVKIQYPGVAEAIRDDLANSELLTTFYRFAAATSGTTLPDLRSATREIAARISEEIDYRHEAANITAFSQLYRDHPFIRIPEVVHEVSGDRVLTMSYLDGMDWAAAQQADQDLKNTWAEVIWRFVAGSFRHANLFFADPHPGNYRFRSDGQVGFVDFGCVKVLPELLRRNAIALDRAALEGRMGDMRELMVDMGMFTSDSTITTEEAYQWYAELLYEWLAPQPVTYMPDTAQRAVRTLIDVRSPDHVVRRMSIPEDLVFMTRINLSVNSICAALRATVHARALCDDLDGVAEPITPLGKQHVAWVRRRGLPFGLEPQ